MFVFKCHASENNNSLRNHKQAESWNTIFIVHGTRTTNDETVGFRRTIVIRQNSLDWLGFVRE